MSLIACPNNYRVRLAVGEVKTLPLKHVTIDTSSMTDNDRRILHCFQSPEGLKLTGIRVGVVILKATGTDMTLTVIVHEVPFSDKVSVELNKPVEQNNEILDAIAA